MLMLPLVLALSLPFAPPSPSLRVTQTATGDRQAVLTWDENPPADPANPDILATAGYLVTYGIESLHYTAAVDVKTLLTASIIIPGTDTPYFFSVRAYSSTGVLSDYAAEVSTQTTVDRCARPLGDRSVSIFVTTVIPGLGGRGELRAVDFQLASPNSPIVTVTARLDGAIVRAMKGEDLLSSRGIWFTTPVNPGLYVLTVDAANAFGCQTLQTKDALGRQIIVEVK